MEAVLAWKRWVWQQGPSGCGAVASAAGGKIVSLHNRPGGLAEFQVVLQVGIGMCVFGELLGRSSPPGFHIPEVMGD